MGTRGVRLSFIFAVAALASAAAPRSYADTFVTVANGDKVTGSIFPAGETEEFMADLVAGTLLDVTAKGRGTKDSAPPSVTIEILDPSFQLIGGANTTPIKNGAKAKKVPCPVTGRYRVRIRAADATGDYGVTIKWKSPTRTAVSGALDDAGSEFTQSFVAEAGSRVSVSVRAGKGQSVQPRVRAIDGAGFHFDAPSIPSGPKGQSVKKIEIPTTGEYSLTFGADDTGGGGAFVGAITVSPPKRVATKLLLTTDLTGDDPDAGSAVAGRVGPLGGLVDGFLDGDGPLPGASVFVPTGALAFPSILVISSGRDVAPPTGMSASGPAIAFTPDGQQFAAGRDVTITIPFDPEAFDSDLTGLTVAVRDADGDVTTVDSAVYDINVGRSTVSFPSTHFSTYQVFGVFRVRRWDFNADGFEDLVVPAPRAMAEAGRVYIFNGRRGFAVTSVAGADLRLDGPAAASNFGESVAAGDVNGDGFPDLIVGAPGANKAYVYFGGANFPSAITAGSPDVLFSGQAGSQFGFRVAAGDVTGDGVDDVIVGAPEQSDIEVAAFGAVYVFAGSSGIHSTDADSASVALYGDGDDSRLGSALAVGRLRGGAAADIAMGSTLGEGSVIIVDGGPALSSDTASQIGQTLTGGTVGDAFGFALAIGDENADGVGDLVVGAPGYDLVLDTTEVDRGAFYVFRGPSLAGAGPQGADILSLGYGDATDTAMTGTAVQIANVFGDARADLLYGGPGDDNGNPDAGYAAADRPGHSDIDNSFTAGERRGAAILYPVDIDGNGRKEFLVVAPDFGGDLGLVRIHIGPGVYGGRTVLLVGASGDHLGGR